MISFSAWTFMRLIFFYSDTHVRLTGHNATFAGRVEVFSHGVWGRVWSNHWDQTEAAVVCRQLGFPGVITALKYSPFGEGSGPVLMSNVQCNGSEKTLQQCQYVDWVKSYWNDKREVGVICTTHDFDPDESVSIRLTGSSVPNAGRIEVLYSGIWGAISRSNWDINDATVACRQLGYQAGAEAALANGVYGPVSGPVWLTNLHCSGSEINVMSCSHDVIGNKSESERRGYIASVICSDGSLPNGMQVRLRGSHSPNMGRVEVYYAGKWGAIHANNWDINDATVVCRQQGYSTALLSGYTLFCSADVPHWFTNFRCYGNESSLDQCAWDFYPYPYLSTYCANVLCKDEMTDSGLDMRLRGSSVPHAGRVELRLKGVWGTLYYDPRYDYDNVTRVICRQFNFTDGILAFDYSVFGPGTGPLWFQAKDLQCIGNESNLLNCSHPEAQLTIVYHHYYDLSVVCKPDVPQTNDFQVRLTGSSSLPFAGTIEVLYYGVWGGVLGRGYVDINVGHVVCRQLGYSGAGEIFQHAAFGKVKGPFWIWRIQCNGHEKEISHCAVTTWDNITNVWYQSYYQQPQYAAGVLCNEANYSASKKLKVRLAGAPISNAGRVEVFYAGVWGTVYSWSGWDINDAHVVCRQLGYPGAISYGRSNQFGIGSGPVWFSNVRCLGNESNIGECPKNVYGYSNSHIATAQCKLPYLSDTFPNCSEVKCANNGTCIKTGVVAVCNCTEGFTGLHCEIPTFNPCQSSPCENGGKCFSKGSLYFCACPKGLTGQRCEGRILTAINPCQSRPCPNNASCHDNETDYTCVPNDKETAYNRIPLNSATSTPTVGPATFNAPFIVVLSVSVALIVLLAAAVVYLILQIRRLTKHQPNTPRVVFSNAAYKGDSADNLDEEVNYSNDVDLGTGTTQTGQDPDPIYEEAPARPLPPIPPPHNTTRKEGTIKTDSKAAAKKANNSYGDVTSTTQAEQRYMGLSRTNGNNATPNASGAAGMLSNSYMSLSPAERPGPSSYSARAQTSAGMKQHGNNGKRRKESHEMYENTRK